MILGEMIQKIGFHVDSHQLEGLHERLEGINRNVKVIAGIEVAHALYELAERFANMGEHLESTALSAGLTTTELQKLQFAASQNAVGNDELSGALAKLNRQLYSAKQGSKQAQAVFGKLGIGPEQISTFATSADALAAIQDKMMGVSDANERQAITMQLFGRGSSNMIKFLVQGSKATEDLGNSAERMGAVVSEQGVKNLAEFEDAASGLTQVFKSFMATVGSQLAPVFIQVIHNIERAWADNLPAIQRNIRTFAIKAAYYIGFTAEFVRLLMKLVSAFAEDHMGLLAFVAKWAPAVMAAAAAFDLFVEALGKVNSGWQLVKKYAPPGWKALLWGMEKLQLFALYGVEALISFFNMFSPGLALRIRAVGLSMATLTPVQFTLAVAAIVALGIALKDAYDYFFNDVPFEKLWIGRLLKKLEPIIARMKWLFKPFKELFMLGDLDADDPSRALTFDEAQAAARRGPMSSAAASLPNLFGGAQSMGQRFDPNDPVNNGTVKTSVMVHMPVSVTVPPNTNRSDSIYMIEQGVKGPLIDALNRGVVDTQPAAAR
jgi:hypothetical protein